MSVLLPYLRLLRVGTLFSPGADVVAGICLLGAPLDWRAAPALPASVLLYAAGMVFNDFADRRVDAEARPERPLPRGQIAPHTALLLGLCLLVGALLLSPWWPYHAAMAALVLLYDFGAKRQLLAGALLMGSLRALNLGSGVWVGAWRPELQTPVFGAALAYAVYIVAVTLLGVLEDDRQVRARVVVSLQAVPPLAALVALFTVQQSAWPAPTLALLPIAALLLRNRAVRTWDQRAIRGSMTWLLLGTMLYTALLCLAAGRPWAAGGVALCVLPARWISRRIALT
jgi:4-hydroxybenzoate polyprenyltransferase